MGPLAWMRGLSILGGCMSGMGKNGDTLIELQLIYCLLLYIENLPSCRHPGFSGGGWRVGVIFKS